MPKVSREQLCSVLSTLQREFDYERAYRCILDNEARGKPVLKLIKEDTQLKHSLLKVNTDYFILTKVYVGQGEHGHVRVGVLLDWKQKVINPSVLRAFKSWFNVNNYQKLEGVLLNQSVFQGGNHVFFTHKGNANRPGVYQDMPLFGLNLDSWFRQKTLDAVPFFQRCAIAIACVTAMKKFHNTAYRQGEQDYFYAHGDVKFDNFVFDSEENQIELIDFDFALRINEPIPKGRLAGTPYYMAPELLLNNQGSLVSQKTDYYALAAVVGEILGDRYQIITTKEQGGQFDNQLFLNYLEQKLQRYEQLQQGWFTLYKSEKHAKAQYIKEVLIPKLKSNEQLSQSDFEWLSKHTGVGYFIQNYVSHNKQPTKTSVALECCQMHVRSPLKKECSSDARQYSAVFKEKRKAKLNTICANETERLKHIMSQPLVFEFHALRQEVREVHITCIEQLTIALLQLSEPDLNKRAASLDSIVLHLQQVLKCLYEKELMHYFKHSAVAAQWADLMILHSSCSPTIVEAILELLKADANIPFVLLQELKNNAVLSNLIQHKLSRHNQYYPILFANTGLVSKQSWGLLTAQG